MTINNVLDKIEPPNPFHKLTTTFVNKHGYSMKVADGIIFENR